MKIFVKRWNHETVNMRNGKKTMEKFLKKNGLKGKKAKL